MLWRDIEQKDRERGSDGGRQANMTEAELEQMREAWRKTGLTDIRF